MELISYQFILLKLIIFYCSYILWPEVIVSII